MIVPMHHITRYESDIDTLFTQARDIIKIGGVLHIGEGNVDITANEKSGGWPVSSAHLVSRAFWFLADYSGFPPRQWHFGEKDKKTTMHTPEGGMVGIEHVSRDMIFACLFYLDFFLD